METEANAAIKQPPWVLVLEDDFLVTKAYTAKFAHEGIQAKIVGDGEAGLAALREEKLPSLIILDLMLPKKDGFEVLQEIKNDPRLNTIPVIILSNLAQETDAKRGLALGAREYFVKSEFNIEELAKKVKEYLKS